MDDWSGDDPEAASTWIRSLPGGNLRDSASKSLVEKIHGDDPAGALEWANQIKDEDLRTQYQQRVFQSWLPDDPQKAMQALQSLPAEVQERIFSDKDE
jgi:hypothetical protein